MTPIRAIARGLLAGAIGTGAMDVLWFVRYKREGGEDDFIAWELSSGLCSWEQAPAPAQIGRRLLEGVFKRQVPPQRAALVSNVTHWAYGALGGGQYGVVAGSFPAPAIPSGLVFGSAVWATGYAVLPVAKLYKPIWEYDVKTLSKDLSAHLVYGLTTAAAFRALSGRSGTADHS